MTAASSHPCLSTRKHPELLPKLFVLPKAISHQKLAPFPPSPPAEGSRNLLAVHSHGHQGWNWGHHLGDNKVLEVLLSSLEPRALQGAGGSGRNSPRHSSTFPSQGQRFWDGWEGTTESQQAGKPAWISWIQKGKSRPEFPPLPAQLGATEQGIPIPTEFPSKVK